MFQHLDNIMNMRSVSQAETWHHIHDEVWGMLQNIYLHAFSEQEEFIRYFKHEWEGNFGINKFTYGFKIKYK